MHFFEAVIAASVKPCIVIVLDIVFKHSLCPSALDLDLALQWFVIILLGSGIKVHFSEAMIAVSVKSCIIIVHHMLFKHALWPDALDLDSTLKWLCCDFMSSLALK